MSDVSTDLYREYRYFAHLGAEEKRRFVSQLSDAEALQLKYTWEAWARDKQLEPAGDWRVWIQLMGRGCIAADTLIYDPSANTHTTVEELARQGKPITVLAMTEKGPQPAMATAPFVKGIAPLYRVTLEDGRQITTTLFHRFLTPHGWKMLSSLAKDDLIGCAPDLQTSNSELDLLMFPADGPHCSQTGPGSQDHCYPFVHQCGELPHQAVDTALISLPSQAGEGRCTHSCERRDAQGIGPEHTRLHHMLVDLLSRSSYAQDELQLSNEGCQVVSYDCGYTPQKHQVLQQSHGLTSAGMQGNVAVLHQWVKDYAPLPIHSDDACDTSLRLSNVVESSEVIPQHALRYPQWTCLTHAEQQPVQWEPLSPCEALPHFRQDAAGRSEQKYDSALQSFEETSLADTTHKSQQVVVDVLSYMDYTSWRRILSIAYVSTDVFYDLTVPGPANYLANGIWNHNSGKTRSGAEWIRKQAKEDKVGRFGLIGRTAADVRDVMVEGESGIIAIHPKWEMPKYEPSKRRLTWPNGAIATTYSADEPDLLRGPQHSKIWADELAAWDYSDTWDQAMFGLRLGTNPQAMVTTTPRPTKLIKQLIALPTTHVTRGSTYENKDNLAAAFIEQIISKYSGTRLGRQEIFGEVIEDVEGALWTRDMIERSRIRLEDVPAMRRIVISVDPAVTSGETSDMTGIAVLGIGTDGLGYVLHSEGMRASPDTWAKRVSYLYHYYQADRVIAEVNQGGDLVVSVMHTIDRTLPVKVVRATRGKMVRAEPVAALWEQQRVRMVS